MKPFLLILLILGLAGNSLFSQENWDISSTVLEEYVREGLESNLQLQRKKADYRINMELLHQARAHFFPDIQLQSRYSVADGGRIIDFPVGNLLNPVYSTLNQLTGSALFPSIENEQIPFLRPTEHETRMRLTQPIINSDVGKGYDIARVRAEMERIGLENYRRELTAEICMAYYDYLKAVSLAELVDENRELARESIRVNRRLLENNKVTKDVVYRSEAEYQKVMHQKAKALQAQEMAASWFNFLLNRSLADTIRKDSLLSLPAGKQLSLAALEDRAGEHRKEILQMDQAVEAGQLLASLYRRKAIPTLSLVVDYGFLGEEIRFSGDDDYVLASLVMQVPLSHGWENRARIREAEIRKEQLELQRKEVRQQILLEVRNAYYELRASLESLSASGLEVRAAREAYQIIDKKYTQGQINLIGLIDARTRLFNAGERFIQARYNVYQKYILLQKAAARNISGS